MSELDRKVGNTNLDELIREVEQLSNTDCVSETTLESLAILIDTADDSKNQAALIRAIELAECIEKKCRVEDVCLVYFYSSNAWSGLHRLRNNSTNTLAWEQPELLKQIYYLRAAIQHEGYFTLQAQRRAQLHCNLGIALSSVGRFVEAHVEFHRALQEQPILGIARGQLGKGLADYGFALYDAGHQELFLRRSKKELERAVAGGVGSDGSTYPEAISYFQSRLNIINAILDTNNVDLSPVEKASEAFSLGRGRKEKMYRQWALERNLFLNPLNDLGADSIAARDVLNLPSHCANKAGITYLAFFNQIKQEYAYARWCLYDGSTNECVRPADRQVMLTLNYDYAEYSIGLEQVKTAFRCAYSLLDKAAYFINDYWNLGIPERWINFRSVWFEESKGKNEQPGLRHVFANSMNKSLLGLFWLSKDIYSKDLRDVAQPNAKDLDNFRNHLEHKYVKIVYASVKTTNASGIFEDRLAYELGRDELVAKAVHMLQQSRSAIIYLCLAMHFEEQRSQKPEGFVFPLNVDNFPDYRKT